MSKASRIVADFDFDQPGEHRGFLRVPFSTHRSAYGFIPIPIVVFNHGDGPQVLLMAGNHGDEYEGQVGLMKLLRKIRAEEVCGRLIVLPCANFPAARAGTRTSPIDGGNLNRSFPGDPDGTPTQMIAHFIESQLLSIVDYAFDVHSGGSSLLYLPCATGARSGDAQRDERVIALLREFGAPLAYMAKVPQGEDRTFSAATERAQVLSIGTELGGSGLVTPTTMRIVERGIGRLLRHVGSVPELKVEEPPSPSRLMAIGGSDYYTYSPDYGLWEPYVDLGDEVEAGQLAAAVHFPETPWREPETVRFSRNGLVICKRIPGQVERGDCLFHVATDLDES